MKNYEENDSELVFLVQEENEEAKEALIKKYTTLINSIVYKYLKHVKTLGIDKKDLYQEGLLGFLESIDKFEEERNIKFNTYISKCVENRIISYLRSCSANKHKSLNESIAGTSHHN